MIWDSVDDWDEPRFRAKQDENNGACKRLDEAIATHTYVGM